LIFRKFAKEKKETVIIVIVVAKVRKTKVKFERIHSSNYVLRDKKIC